MLLRLWTFNSLYEILFVWYSIICSFRLLSILFMRFDKSTGQVLSVLQAPFNSLYEILRICVFLKILKYKPSFNSLYEILRITINVYYESWSIFQFSLWDSPICFWIKLTVITFNSLYEIPILHTCRYSNNNNCLSILFMRFCRIIFW